MALMFGLTSPTDGPEGSSGSEGFPSKVQAVVNVAGVVDLAKHYQEAAQTYRMNVPVVVNLRQGTPEERPKEYEAASPVNYVTADAPPVLTPHGDKDRRIWLEMSETLDRKMWETIFEFLESHLKPME